MSIITIGLALGCGLALLGAIGVIERVSEEKQQAEYAAQHEANMRYNEWLDQVIEKAVTEGKVMDIKDAQGQKTGELYFYAGNSTWCFTINHQLSCTNLK